MVQTRDDHKKERRQERQEVIGKSRVYGIESSVWMWMVEDWW